MDNPKPSQPSRFSANERWDGRFMLYTSGLIVVLAVITGLLVHVQNRMDAKVTEENTTPISRKALSTESAAKAEPSSETIANISPSQTPFDKKDKKRLLSILSNY